MNKSVCILTFLGIFPFGWTFAQLSIKSTTTTYTQNFNSLKTSGTSSSLPTGWKLLETGSNANTTYAADTGASETGNTYSYGKTGNTDRSLGMLRSSALSPVIGVQVKNATGKVLKSITVTYTGEQWRCGAAGRQDRIDFQYSTNAASLSTGTWNDLDILDFISPNTLLTGALDGNLTGNRETKSGTISGLNINNSATFWLRWTDYDTPGNDDGLSVDDFSLSVSTLDAIPPVVVSLSPANASGNVPTSGNLIITFSENMAKGTGNITVKALNSGTVALSIPVTGTSVTVSGVMATVSYSNLSFDTGYFVEIPAGTFKDLSGNVFEGISGSSAWSFTTQSKPSLSVVPSALDFGEIETGKSSASQTFAFTVTNLTGGLILTAPSGFELSKNNGTFSGSLTYSTAELPAQTVYARFRPLTADLQYSGSISFSGTGLNENQVLLTGTSIRGSQSDTFRIVNWNIENFGTTSGGPTDDNLQEQNVRTVMKNINADIYGLVEVVSASRLQNIVSQMPGFSYIVSDFCSSGSTPSACASAQKLAFVYRTSVINKLRTYGVLRYGGSSDAYYNWSSGRFPYLMEAEVTCNGTTQLVQFVVIHGKANTADYVTSYNRRKYGAEELHDSLMVQFPNSNWVVFGDFNDDLDKTITTQVYPVTETSYVSFVNESTFVPITLPLSLAGQRSTVSYPDVIDHVTISDDMNRFYVANSAKILKTEVESWIPNYGNTTSDHYPVLSKFVISASAPLAQKSGSIEPLETNMGNRMKCLSVSRPGQVDLFITHQEQLSTNIQLIDLNGRVWQTAQTQTTNGTIKVTMNTSGLSSQVCLLRVFNKKGIVVEKLWIR